MRNVSTKSQSLVFADHDLFAVYHHLQLARQHHDVLLNAVIVFFRSVMAFGVKLYHEYLNTPHRIERKHGIRPHSSLVLGDRLFSADADYGILCLAFLQECRQ